MTINSNATSAIVNSLFRLVRDGSALHGPEQTALYAFGSLSGCFSVAPMHLEQACCAALVNVLRCKTWLCIGSSLWKSNRLLNGSPVEPTKNRQEH